MQEVQQPPAPPDCCGSLSVHVESTVPARVSPSVVAHRASRMLLKKFQTPVSRGMRPERKELRDGLHTAIWQYARSKTTPREAKAEKAGAWIKRCP